jgi:hypothetical protein
MIVMTLAFVAVINIDTDNTAVKESVAEVESDWQFAIQHAMELPRSTDDVNNMLQKLNHVAPGQVIANIRSLKAYSVAAYDKAMDTSTSGEKTGVLVNLIKQFGSTWDKKGNVVADYTKIIGGLLSKCRGILHYLVAHVNKSILFGKGMVTYITRNKKLYAVFGYRRLGLTKRPKILLKLMVTAREHKTQLAKVMKLTKGADKAFKMKLIQEELKRHYKKFFKAGKRARDRLEAKEEEQLAMAAVQAEQRAFGRAVKAGKRRLALVPPMPPAGLKGAEGATSTTPIPPTEAVVKAKAIAGSQSWLKSAQGSMTVGKAISTVLSSRSTTKRKAKNAKLPAALKMRVHKQPKDTVASQKKFWDKVAPEEASNFDKKLNALETVHTHDTVNHVSVDGVRLDVTGVDDD